MTRIPHPLHAFEEFRSTDGWPICPNCGQDQLESYLRRTEPSATVIECIEDEQGFICGNCGNVYGMPPIVRDRVNEVTRARELREDRKNPPKVDRSSPSQSESPSPSATPSVPDLSSSPSRSFGSSSPSASPSPSRGGQISPSRGGQISPSRSR